LNGQLQIKWASAVILAAYIILLALETLFPLRGRKLPRKGRFMVNASMTALVFIAGGLVVRTVGLSVAAWAEAKPFGLLHIAAIPAWARFAAGFLLMDLTFYYWHRINHGLPILWRFHNVHHADPDMDVTTSFRFHLVEVLYSTGFRAVQVLITGVSPFTYAVYEIFFTCETAFHHSNLRLPVRLESFLNKVIVTPRMHGIHHSFVMEETNSNYSTIFRWWDLLHHTLDLGVPQKDITIGVPAYSLPEDNGFLRLNVMPFEKQRDYWRLPDGGTQKRGEHDRRVMVE
jgi:sterol desaturase/sphingolipid hydroxylase (fatty acid hydroxylase superfamily)